MPVRWIHLRPNKTVAAARTGPQPPPHQSQHRRGPPPPLLPLPRTSQVAVSPRSDVFFGELGWFMQLPLLKQQSKTQISTVRIFFVCWRFVFTDPHMSSASDPSTKRSAKRQRHCDAERSLPSVLDTQNQTAHSASSTSMGACVSSVSAVDSSPPSHHHPTPHSPQKSQTATSGEPVLVAVANDRGPSQSDTSASGESSGCFHVTHRCSENRKQLDKSLMPK